MLLVQQPDGSGGGFVDFSVPAVLRSLADAGAAVRELAVWRARARGDQRRLVGELKENLHYLDMVVEDGVPLERVVEKLSDEQYRRLADAGYNFNSLQRRRIDAYPSLKGTDLAGWQGKETEALVEAIYDKLKEIRIKHPVVSGSSRYRWSVRVQNIRKRIWLLLRHVRD